MYGKVLLLLIIAVFVASFAFSTVAIAGEGGSPPTPPENKDGNPDISLTEPAPAGPAPAISLPDTTYDFGVVAQSASLTHVFKVLNKGDAPLKIIKVKASWGCTAAIVSATEIPPGGEGEIKVTLNTGRKKGRLRKSIRVESNDPISPKLHLRVEAMIKIETPQEDFSLNMDNVRKDGQTVKDVYIETKKFPGIEVADILSSSTAITAREIKPADSTQKADSVHIQITLGPGLKLGLLSERITVSFRDDLRPKAKFFLYGIIVDDIEVTPLRLTYIVNGPELDTANMSRKLTVTNYMEDQPLEIVDVTTPGNYLDMTVKTIEKGLKLEILAVANEKVLAVDSTLENKIYISTNNPEMRVIKIPYSVIRK